MSNAQRAMEGGLIARPLWPITSLHCLVWYGEGDGI